MRSLRQQLLHKLIFLQNSRIENPSKLAEGHKIVCNWHIFKWFKIRDGFFKSLFCIQVGYGKSKSFMLAKLSRLSFHD